MIVTIHYLLMLHQLVDKPKRHIQQINYSEEFGDDLDFDEFPSSTPGTRSLNENKAQIEAQRYSLAKNTPTPKRILENRCYLSWLKTSGAYSYQK